jgi:hypothetical protein
MSVPSSLASSTRGFKIARQNENRAYVPSVIVPTDPGSERYDGKEVSPVHLAASDPVSTFSVDVDTGAYANSRRFLSQGQLPPADAVRSEELVNYFRYDYPLPATRETPFSVTTDVAATPWNPATRLLRIGLRGYDLPRSARPPANLVFLVDVSGSMERYARLLLAFLHAATREHRRRDVFAFGTHLTDLTPAFRLADTDDMLAAASAAISDYAGGTKLGESLTTLREQHARKLVGRRTLVLIISDGLDTGEPEVLARELDWLVRRCRRLLWLNPLLRYDAYEPAARGASVLHARAHGMLAVHNLSRLEDLAAGLAAVMR